MPRAPSKGATAGRAPKGQGSTRSRANSSGGASSRSRVGAAPGLDSLASALAGGTNDGRRTFVLAVAAMTRNFLTEFYGSVERAVAEASNNEMDVFIERAFTYVAAQPHGNARGNSRPLRTSVCAELGFDRLIGARKERDRRTTCAKLSAMRPEWAPKIGTHDSLNKHQNFFMLDLCAGTKPFSSVCEHVGVSSTRRMVVVTVDIDETRKPTWCEDVTDWKDWLPRRLDEMRSKYADFQNFHYVHFSPECTELAASKTVGTRDVATALELVLYGVALILELEPPVWTIESSASGQHCLAKQPIMHGLASRKLAQPIHFCKASGEGNFKPGDWWSSFPRAFVSDICGRFTCKSDQPCPWRFVGGGAHPKASQSGRTSAGTPGMARDDLMRFPQALVEAWLAKVFHWLSLRPSRRSDMYQNDDESR